jgi:hypothetical protein
MIARDMRMVGESMKPVSIALALMGLIVALRAAHHWYKSSQVVSIPPWVAAGGAEPADLQASQMGWLTAILEAVDKSAQLNKSASIWTACAVVLGAASNVAGVFP